MAEPKDQILLVDASGNKVEFDQLLDKLRCDPARVMADDEIGFVIYVGDLDLYRCQHLGDQTMFSKVTEISGPRHSTEIVRRQIGGLVLSVTADKVFVVRNGDQLRKVRADMLKPGMILSTGEKVFR
jgi:hypothetical protein